MGSQGLQMKKQKITHLKKEKRGTRGRSKDTEKAPVVQKTRKGINLGSSSGSDRGLRTRERVVRTS